MGGVFAPNEPSSRTEKQVEGRDKRAASRMGYGPLGRQRTLKSALMDEMRGRESGVAMLIARMRNVRLLSHVPENELPRVTGTSAPATVWKKSNIELTTLSPYATPSCRLPRLVGWLKTTSIVSFEL